MEIEFQTFIESNNLCKKTDRILLGVSGGIDSVCMFHLFRLAGYPIAIAHCNFQLRGEESEQDELFVSDLANMYDIPFFFQKFNTGEIAEMEKISIQMAARDLRYEWFSEIKNKYEYNYIAIAHNRDDVIETFLTNLTRGSGIKGLTGIKPKVKQIIRPILFASREDIIIYTCTNNIDYCEDSSNRSVKYNRNLIRHEIIPLFEKLNPRFRETMIENTERLKEAEEVYSEKITENIERVIRKENNCLFVNIDTLRQLNPINAYLYEILHPFGFSKAQIVDIKNSLNGISGKKFYSLTHRLIKDRTELIIDEISVKPDKSYFISSNTYAIQTPISLNFSNLKQNDDFNMIKSARIGLFDFDSVEYPLILRKWRKGDCYMPLGMKSLKKLSDFFIDNKLPITEKENVWILESGNKIMWVIGHRIDERFKIKDETNNILKIELVVN